MIWIVISSLLALSYAQDFRLNVEGPILINNNSYGYYCNILDTLNRPIKYDVTFLFDFQPDPSIPIFPNINGNDRAFLEQKYLENKMNQQIRCRANNTATNTLVTSANYINIGIETAFVKTIRDAQSTCDSCVTEADKDPLDIRYTATVPFRCLNTHLYTSCNITANLTTTDNIVVKGVVADKPCMINFTISDSDKLFHSNVSIYAVKDDFNSPVPRPNYVLLNFPTFPSYTANGTTYQDNWNNFQQQTDIRHIDRPRGYCTVSGVSQVTTFDGYNYPGSSVGQFSYVKSISGTPFEVQLRHWPCTLDSDESCVCGVAVQEADLDVVIDMCIDGVAKFITHSCIFFPTESGVKVITNTLKNRFAIIFPSGNRVYGSIIGREMSLDIYVNSDTQGLQEGLCGTFDQDSVNDQQQASNPDQWRLPINGSIFDGVLTPIPKDVTTLTSFSGESYCSCKNGVATCAVNKNNFDLMDQLSYGMNTSVQPRVPGDFGSCNFRMDASYYSRRYLYYNGMTSSYTVGWPTASGITEAEAGAYCLATLWTMSPISKVCSALTQADIDGIVTKCKIEIGTYGYNESAKNIEPELGRLCISKGAATASGQGMTGLGSLFNLSMAYCDSFTCNFNGNCTNSVCSCAAGIASTATSDCAFFTSTKVQSYGLYGNNLCDVRTEDCTKFLYYSQNVDADFPWCRFIPSTVYFGATNLGQRILQGNDVDENGTICYVPKEYLDIVSYANDSRVPLAYRGGPILFNVSFGNEQLAASMAYGSQLLLYDSLCYNCTNTPTFNCVLKNTDNLTCFINGYCFPNNTVRSGDPTLYCNVNLNRTIWSPVPPPPTTTPTIPTTLGTGTQPAVNQGAITTLAVNQGALTNLGVNVVTSLGGGPQTTATVSYQITTAATTPLIDDLYAVLNNYRTRKPFLTDSQINAQAQAFNQIMAQNPDCVNASTIASQVNPPAFNSTLSDQQNFLNFLKTYCNVNNPTLLNTTAGLMAASLQSVSTNNTDTTDASTTSSSTLSNSTIGAIVAGVLGALALISLLLTCCCCWPYIYPCLQTYCCRCCPWLNYTPQQQCVPAPVCVQAPVCVPAPVCVQQPVCAPRPVCPQVYAYTPPCPAPVRDCGDAWKPITATVYVKSSPGCVDPCSKPISRNLVPYKERYFGATSFEGYHGSNGDFGCKRCL